MKLVKDIVPVDEQLGDPGKFDLNIDGEGGYDATKSDAGDGDCVELDRPQRQRQPRRGRRHRHQPERLHQHLQLHNLRRQHGRAGQRLGHLVIELPVSAGDDWRCVLRNERKQAGVKLTKVIVAVDQQLGDPGKFDLNIDGEGAYDKSMRTPSTATRLRSTSRTARSVWPRRVARRRT